MSRRRASCAAPAPARPRANDPAAQPVAHIPSSPGTAQSVNDEVPAAGVYCYAVFALGALDRPGALATVSHNYLGRPPISAFDGRFTAQRTVAFTDTSTDTDGQVVAWSWNFGDNTTIDRAQPDAHVHRGAATTRSR